MLRSLLTVLLVGATLQVYADDVKEKNEFDHIANLQIEAFKANKASWGYWGIRPDVYSDWRTHSNRLIPIYTFGIGLEKFTGENSRYRHPERISELYGRVPENTLNPNANYMDQTDVYWLQKHAVESGKKRVILFVFDGMDWQTTQAAAIHNLGKVGYTEGRGTGLHFLDYRGAPTDYGYHVTSPHNAGTKVDVNSQTVENPGGRTPGGYDYTLAGSTPWETPREAAYLISKSKHPIHAYVDSAASATAMTSGTKTYNDSVNVDSNGAQVEPIAHELQREGFAIGVVTSVPISHATPAAAYSNNVSRNDFQDITRDLLGLNSIAHRHQPLPGVDVLIGGGYGVSRDADKAQGNNFIPGNRYLAEPDYARINVENGGKYVIGHRTEGRPGSEVLQEAAQKAIDTKNRFFGYFGTSYAHLPFSTADGKFDPTPCGNKSYDETITEADVFENPTLADMSIAALEILSKRSDKFWLMLEAGDVDWGNHGNNIDFSIGATIDGDKAFKAVVEWIEQNGGWDDTALILTADHGHHLVITQPEALLPPAATESTAASSP